jgi:DNA-binding phage protein
MIRQISWEQFGILLGATMLLYYLAVGWFYYRTELTGLYRSWRKIPAEQLVEEDKPISILGKAREEEGINDVNAEDLVIAAPAGGQQEAIKNEPAPEPIKKPEAKTAQLNQQIDKGSPAFLLGTVADVMEEMKGLLDMGKQSGENRETLLKALLLMAPNLQQLAGTKYQDAISLHLLEEVKKRFAFEYSLADLKPLWPQVHQAKQSL